MLGHRIPTAVVPSVAPVAMTPSQVGREFRRLLDQGVPLNVSGTAAHRPLQLLARGYTPKHRVDLFDTRFYLTNPRQNPDLRFFVAYVLQGTGRQARIYARILYKDISLIWRAASHIVYSQTELWIGKGAVATTRVHGAEVEHSVESTTDLPLEMQQALETLNRVRRVLIDERALKLILRRGPSNRIAPYRDFTDPRRRAAVNRANLIHGGRRVARFQRPTDPTSLRIVSGYEPDFSPQGVVERVSFRSSFYGGRIQRFRVLSRNRRIQFGFMAAPRHVWVIPPQALTTELSSFGVRTVDVLVDEDLCVPGYEYHFWEINGESPELHSQIPAGFAGEPSDRDEDRSDASPWNEEIPLIREFRRKVLRR